MRLRHKSVFRAMIRAQVVVKAMKNIGGRDQKVMGVGGGVPILARVMREDPPLRK